MRKGIFSKLAVQNIRNNKSTYIPYMITCIFCIAMIYMMEFLRDCPTLDQYEAERCRAGQYLYLKYRSFAHDFHDCLYLFWYE